MKLFSELAKLLQSNTSLVIAIYKNSNGSLTVTVMPKMDVKDDAKDKLRPLSISASPEQLDEEFISVITKPLEVVVSLAKKIEEYEKHVKEVESETAMKKKEKDENKKKIEKVLEEAVKLSEKKQFQSALAKVEEARKLGATNKEIDDKVKNLKEMEKKQEPNIFSPTGDPGPTDTSKSKSSTKVSPEKKVPVAKDNELKMDESNPTSTNQVEAMANQEVDETGPGYMQDELDMEEPEEEPEEEDDYDNLHPDESGTAAF